MIECRKRISGSRSERKLCGAQGIGDLERPNEKKGGLGRWYITYYAIDPTAQIQLSSSEMAKTSGGVIGEGIGITHLTGSGVLEELL